MLRVEVNTEDKENAMRTAVRMAAKHIMTTAMLISDGQEPDIAIDSQDFFEGKETIELADDIE
jgi:hypothetical protein